MRAAAARLLPCLCALGGLGLLAPEPCAAQPLQLVWNAPAECPTLDDVRPILDAVVPQELRETLGTTRVVIDIVAGEQYVATIRVERDGHVGERVVEGARCAEVARSALIVVSVALGDPEGPNPVAEPAATPLVTPEPEDPAHDEPVIPEPTHERWAIDAGVGVISGLGDAPLVPRLSFGVLRAVLPALSIGVRAQAVPFAPLNHDGERVARAATVTLAPVACLLAPVSGSVRVGGCLSAEVGLTLARGLGLDQNGHGARAYGAIGISPSVLLGRRASVRLSVDLDVRITQPRFEVTGLGEVGRARSVGFGGTCAFFFWAS